VLFEFFETEGGRSPTGVSKNSFAAISHHLIFHRDMTADFFMDLFADIIPAGHRLSTIAFLLNHWSDYIHVSLYVVNYIP
jgi:hypothetical protein